MTGLPEITVAGTLTADPDLRYTPSGAAVANFTVAANERRYDKDNGRWVDGAPRSYGARSGVTRPSMSRSRSARGCGCC